MIYTVKEVSILTNVTIRTLRYYDEIGLLVTDRNENGHRIYRSKDIMHLTMISSLKSLGVSLNTIKDILNTQGYDLQKVLELQKHMINTEIKRLEAERENTEAMLNSLHPEKSLEKTLLENHLDLKDVDMQHAIDFTNNKEIDFTYFYDKIYALKNNLPEALDTMKEFLEYLNQSYSGYFINEQNILNLAEQYQSKEARLYFSKYDKSFNIYLADLLLSIVRKKESTNDET